MQLGSWYAVVFGLSVCGCLDLGWISWVVTGGRSLRITAGFGRPKLGLGRPSESPFSHGGSSKDAHVCA